MSCILYFASVYFLKIVQKDNLIQTLSIFLRMIEMALFGLHVTWTLQGKYFATAFFAFDSYDDILSNLANVRK